MNVLIKLGTGHLFAPETRKNMLRINRLLFCIALLVFALPAGAQQLGAEDILARTSDAFKKAGGVKATFTVQTSEGSSAGTIRLKGDKFLLEADGTTTWFDGRTQWSYLTSSDEVNISEPTPEELQSINPYALLSLHEHGYKLKLGKVENPQLKSFYKLVLTATDRKQDLQCIILYVTKDAFRPARISMAQRGGETALVIIDSYQTGENYPDSLFVFDKKAYPTAEMIDLR